MTKTQKYDQFKFRKDNREKGVDRAHVDRLKKSIEAKNLLEFRPIIVNEKFEIIDGQHRLVAARELGLDIFYQVRPNSDPKDVIYLNITKSWTFVDILNFYVQNDYDEYKKFKAFMENNEITFWIAWDLIAGDAGNKRENFRNGTFAFSLIEYKDVEAIKCIIARIKTLIGTKSFFHSQRFWRALCALVSCPHFELKRLLENIDRFSTKITAKVSRDDYVRLFQEIYNYRTTKKINLFEDRIYD